MQTIIGLFLLLGPLPLLIVMSLETAPLSQSPPPRRFRFSLRALFVGLTIFGLALAWLGVHLKWIADRREARKWFGASTESWYAPSMPGALKVDPPWSLGLFGELGVAGFGLDEKEFAGPAPYTLEQVRRLFPEARVGYSRDGRFVDDATVE